LVEITRSIIEIPSPVYVTIVEDTPILKIEGISGGFGKIKANIKNWGDQPANEITWAISIEGGFLQKIDLTFDGDFENLEVDNVEIINSKFILGFGSIEIDIVADAVNADETTSTVNALICGFLILIIR